MRESTQNITIHSIDESKRVKRLRTKKKRIHSSYIWKWIQVER